MEIKDKGDLARSLQEKNLQEGKWPFGEILGYKRIFSHYAQVVWKEDNPKGYRIRKIAKYKLVEDEKEFEIVADIFITYASNLFSLSLLSDYIEKKYSIKYTLGSICKILTNRFYIGEMIHNEICFPHIYKTPISKDLFEKVQLIKVQNETRRWKSNTLLKFTYRGLIHCVTHQTSILTPEIKKGKFIYYSCTKCKPRLSINENSISSSFFAILDSINISQVFIDSLEANHKEMLIIFKQNYKEWFLKNPDQRAFLIRFLFKDLWWDTNLKYHLNAPFNGDNYQDYLFEELKKIITIFGFFMVENKSSANDILSLLQEPHSINDLLEKLDYSLIDVQNRLIDLQLEGKVEQNQFGYWKAR